MILVTGSLAFDYLMDFDGEFKNSLISEELENLSVSFITSNFRKYFGGTSGNIAHSLKLLEESPLIMATAGYDFEEYMTSLNWRGINTKDITILDDEITASGFITTDKHGNQITMFHPGAMNKAAQKNLEPLKDKIDLAIISPEMKEAMLYYIRECKKNNISYIFDPGQNIGTYNKEELIEATDGAKAFICNSYEWQLFLKKVDIEPRDLLQKLELLIITLGSEGSKIYSLKETIFIPSISPHEVQDPTGCGDAYRAGLLKGLLHDKSIAETGKIASLAATYCLEEHGTQNHKYTMDEFNKRLGEVK